WPRDWSSDVCSSDLPFSLLALQGTGYPPVAVDLDDCQERELAETREIVKQKKQGIQRNRGIWEEGKREDHCEKDNEGPARPARRSEERRVGKEGRCE